MFVLCGDEFSVLCMVVFSFPMDLPLLGGSPQSSSYLGGDDSNGDFVNWYILSTSFNKNMLQVL